VQRPGIEIDSIEWQRIQCVVRARPTGAPAVDPRRLSLRSPTQPPALVPVAHAEVAAGCLIVRVNAMQGPDEMPLRPGRWILVQGDDFGGRELRVLGGRVDPVEHEGRFHVGRRGDFVIAPSVDRDDQTLGFEIRLEPHVPRSAAEALAEVPAPSTTAGGSEEDGGWSSDRAAVPNARQAAQEESNEASSGRESAAEDAAGDGTDEVVGDDTVEAATERAEPGDAERAIADEATPVEPRTRGGRSLRRKAFRAIRRWLRPLRKWGFQLAFNLFRLAAMRNGRRILFTSDSRAELGGNLKLVYDRMVERGINQRYELMQLFRPGLKTPRTWRDRFRLPWLLARADVVLIDDYQPAIYKVQDRNVKIIQLWHAFGSFKTVGYSRIGKPGGPSPWSRVHKNYTYAIVASRNDVAHYAEAFGIPEDRVVATGLPRMDQFLAQSRDQARRGAALRAFPEARGHRTILFAPTFRGRDARTARYDVGSVDFAALHALCVEKDAIFIIRLHPFVRDRVDIPDEYRDRIIDGSPRTVEVNDLLLATDLLVTDYSSIVFEYSTLRRPMLFYAYDLDEYVASRDFYVRYEEWVPGRIVRTFPELLDAIRREDFQADRIGPFVARNFDHLEGGSTDRIIDRLILSG
jgi:CDP-ribitol ribitolphosphotransferase / teichoic acid ribitol-phosphate polymerase